MPDDTEIKTRWQGVATLSHLACPNRTTITKAPQIDCRAPASAGCAFECAGRSGRKRRHLYGMLMRGAGIFIRFLLFEALSSLEPICGSRPYCPKFLLRPTCLRL